MKNKGESILILATAISVMCIVFGNITNTIYLSKFNITGISLLEPRAIIIGFVFVLLVGVSFVLFTLFIDFSEIKNNSLLKINIITIIKIVFITNLIFLINRPVATNQNEVLFLNIDYKVLNLWLWLSTFGIFPLMLMLPELRSKSKLIIIKYFARPILYFFTASFTLLGIVFAFISKDYRSLFIFESVLIFAFYMGFIGFVEGSISTTKFKYFGKGDHSGEIETFLGRLLVVIYTVAMVILLNVTYSLNVFPVLRYEFGGAHSDTTTIIFSNDTITGIQVYNSGTYLYLDVDSNYIKKISWDDIEYLKKPLSSTSPK